MRTPCAAEFFYPHAVEPCAAAGFYSAHYALDHRVIFSDIRRIAGGVVKAQIMPVIRAAYAVAGQPVIAFIADTDSGAAGFLFNLNIFGLQVIADPVTGVGLECGQILLNTEILAGVFRLSQFQTPAAQH